MAAGAFQPILAPCYRLRPHREMTDEEAAIIRSLAGPRIYRRGAWANTIETPENVGWRVEEVCEELGLRLTCASGPTYMPEVDWTALRTRLLRQGEAHASAIDMTFDYQRDGIVWAANHRSSALWWPGGAGKSLACILAALSHTRTPFTPIVFVTKAGARGQWGTAIKTFTKLDPLVMRPLDGLLEVPEAARDLLRVRGLGPKTINKLLGVGIQTVDELRTAIEQDFFRNRPGFGWKAQKNYAAGLTRLRTITESLDSYLDRMRIKKQRPVIVVAWTSLREWWEPLSRVLSQGQGVLVGDELHVAKASKRQRVKVDVEGTFTYTDLENLSSSAAKLSRSARVRIGATATSIKDRLRDLWAQLDWLEPGAWGTSSTWLRRYCAATEGQYGGLITTGIAEEHVEELNSRLAFLVHSVDYATSHAALIGMKRRESWRIGPDEMGSGWDPARLRSELRDARGSHTALVEVQMAAAAATIVEPLIERIKNDVESNPNVKICVFDARHANVDMLSDSLRKALGNVEVLGVHGGNTTPEKREKLREHYMAHPGPIILVATGESVGTGIDLHDTDLGYLTSLPWTLGELHQWEQRWSRHGQRRPCRIVYCIPVGSVTEHLANRLISKMPAIEKVSDNDEIVATGDFLSGTDNVEKIAENILAVMGGIDPDLLGD